MVWGTKAINPLETSWTSKEGFPKLVYRTPSLYSLWSHMKTGISKSTASTTLENVTPGVLHVQEWPRFQCFISVSVSWTEGFWYQVPASIPRVWAQSCTCYFWLAASIHTTEAHRATTSNDSLSPRYSPLRRPKAGGQCRRRWRQPDILRLWRCAGQRRNISCSIPNSQHTGSLPWPDSRKHLPRFKWV